MHARMVLAGLAAIVAIAACGDDDPTPPRTETYAATLNSAQETGTPFTSPASGTATVTVQGNTLNWTLTTAGFPSGTTGPNAATTLPAHIHFGAPGVAGGIMVNLSPFGAPNSTTTGTAVVVDSVLTHLRAGNAYVNIHTAARPGGEIRGQLTRTQ